MKKIVNFLCLIAMCVCMALSITSCTSNLRARRYGGTQTIALMPGQRLVMATWKEDNLWYLTEPMDDEYTPKVKTFEEKSELGVLEGKVVFVESRK